MTTGRPSSISGHATTIRRAISAIVLDPWNTLVRNWNWKSAVCSAVFRSGLFFTVNLAAGWGAAMHALVTEFVLRGATAGFCGAMTQAFRYIEPETTGTLVALVILPAVALALEAVAHGLSRTALIGSSMAVSTAATCVCTSFDLFAMRRGAFIMGPGAQGLLADLRRMPELIPAFTRSIGGAMAQAVRAVMQALPRPFGSGRSAFASGQRLKQSP